MLSKMPEPWKSFLAEVDDTLEEVTEFHCIGGFVIAMLYNFERETSDLDFISCVPRENEDGLYELAGKGSSLYEKYKVYLDPVKVATPPDSYEDRLMEMFPGEFRWIRLCALDPYDLALTKLERSGRTARDLEDVLHLARTVPLNLEIFRQRYNEEYKVYVEDLVLHRSTFDHWINIIEEERGNESSE